MRRALASVAPILSRLYVVERRQIIDQARNEERFDAISRRWMAAIGNFHDRFLILDGAELYHLGASLKDLGRQYCAITMMDAMFIPSIMQRV